MSELRLTLSRQIHHTAVGCNGCCPAVAVGAAAGPFLDLVSLRARWSWTCCSASVSCTRCASVECSCQRTLTDEATGLSLLPASLIQLWLGKWQCKRTAVYRQGDTRSVDCLDWSPSWTEEQAWQFGSLDTHFSYQWACTAISHAAGSARAIRSEQLYRHTKGASNHSLPVGCLPEGLRALFVGESFNQPLLSGSLPSSLVFCHLGACFDQPLAAGVLPSQLRDLLLLSAFNQPLPPGVLPISLQRLCMGGRYNKPLVVGSLPPRLRWLDLGYCFNQMLPPAAFRRPASHFACRPHSISRCGKATFQTVSYSSTRARGTISRSSRPCCPVRSPSLLCPSCPASLCCLPSIRRVWFVSTLLASRVVSRVAPFHR